MTAHISHLYGMLHISHEKRLANDKSVHLHTEAAETACTIFKSADNRTFEEGYFCYTMPAENTWPEAQYQIRLLLLRSSILFMNSLL